MKYLIANWKQNQNLADIDNWIDYVSLALSNKKITNKNLTCVVCPSFLHIFYFKKKIANSLLNSFFVGAQDVSEYDRGAHTGEVGAFQLQDLCDYVIIGHSERKQFGETIESIHKKIILAQQNNLIPIICFDSVQKYQSLKACIDYKKPHLFAYEPVGAIGTGNPASLESIDEIMQNTGVQKLVYGGSVDYKTIKLYVKNPGIVGFLIGSNSLKPSDFVNIIKSLN